MSAQLHGVPLRGILLDLDDTILDNRTGSEQTWAFVAGFLREEIPDLNRDDLLRALKASAEWFWSDAERHRRGRLALTEARKAIVGRTLEALAHSDLELAAEAARRHLVYREQTYHLEQGALQALERLRRSVSRLALVTNGSGEAQRRKIERFGLARFFDHIQIEGEFGFGKPDARVFEHVLACLGLEPKESAMVGDDFERDVLGAHAVGIQAVWIDPEGAEVSPSPAPPPHLTVRSLVELVDRLGCED